MFKTFSRISVCAALAVSFFLSTASRAQDVVVTIPSLNDVQAKVAAVAGKINPTFPLLINMTLGQSAAFGIDGTKPVAVCANPDEEKGFSVVGFIPVKSQKMFDAQFNALKEKGQIPDMKIESKDGYSAVLYNQDSAGEIPTFDSSKMLNLKLNPAILLPIVDQQIAAAELLQDEDLRDAKKINLERAKRNVEQLKEVAFALDASDAGDVEVAFGAKPLEGTDIAKNYANTEQLTESVLCGFFDKKAPFAAQFLGTFDENNRKDLVEALTSTAKIPEELAEVVLKAMEVKKFDIAFSFYPDKLGVHGVLAMGIANGELINGAIEKAIAKISPDDLIQGKANAGTIGKSITVHEFTLKNEDLNKNFVVAVHKNYLFLALAPAGDSGLDYLKDFIKNNKLQASKVKKNGRLHFDMGIVSALMKQLKPEDDTDYTGEVNYVADFSNGEFKGTLKIDNELIETIGKIYSSLNVDVNVDGDNEDYFGDDDDDDDDDDI